jgi:O-antigen ligase
MTLILSLISLSIFGLISYGLWSLAKFEWLSKIAALLVISLPLERIPSISLGGSNIRFSQLLVVFGMWIFITLLVKKDAQLLKMKLNRLNYFLFTFILASIPSWLMVSDFKRFLITEIATFIVFFAFFILSQFAGNIVDRVRDLINTMIFVTLFGYYQFVGDLIGLPFWATGLRETYTKIVFGVPRIHATAIEPLYFAGMLFVCLFTSSSYFFLNKQLVLPSLLKFLKLDKKSNNFINSLLFTFFFIAFLLTISKSAIVIFLAMVPFFSFFLIKIFGLNISNTNNLVKILKRSRWIAFGVIFIFISIYIYIPAVQTIWTGIYSNFADTIYGQSASSDERSLFLKAFNNMIGNSLVIGISSGHYGVEAGQYIPFQTGTDNYLIVNNVYLEVWLEHGLVSGLLFIGMLISILIVFLRKIVARLSINPELSSVNISLFFSLLAYCFQWLTFSPIFIMPIFIIMGLIASNINASEM